MSKDYYKSLGIDRSASQYDIRKAYRKIAKENHPDTHPNDKVAEERFKEASEAYEVLSDEEKKRNYDTYGSADPHTSNYSSSFDPRDIFSRFSSMFGGGFDSFSTNNFTRKNTNGASLQARISISLKEACFGVTRKILLKRQVRCPSCEGEGGTEKILCPKCNGRGTIIQKNGFFTINTTCDRCSGSGRVISHVCPSCHGNAFKKVEEEIEFTIPKGVVNGDRVIIKEKGNEGNKGSRNGDFIAVISIIEDDVFNRNGEDLYLTIPISVTQAILGCEVTIPSLDGKNLKLQIPNGIQSNTSLRIPNYGMYRKNSETRGNLYVNVIVRTPTNLDEEVLDKIRELEELIKSDPSPKPIK